MNDFLRQLASPVAVEEPWCGPADHHAATAAALDHWTATGLSVALGVVLLAWFLWRVHQRGLRTWGTHGLRWLAGGTVALLLLAAPLLALHATHQLEAGPGKHCAVAGIAHSISAAVTQAVQALAPIAAAVVLTLIFLAHQTRRPSPQPIARGPPAQFSLR